VMWRGKLWCDAARRLSRHGDERQREVVRGRATTR
jgi:hypothetical protein